MTGGTQVSRMEVGKAAEAEVKKMGGGKSHTGELAEVT